VIRFHAHQMLVFGGMIYIEREIEGLEPDVVLVALHLPEFCILLAGR
jgi:hypothetical protein